MTARDQISIVNSTMNTNDCTLELTTGESEDTKQWTFSRLLRRINPELYNIWYSIKDREASLDYYIDAIFIKFASLSDYKYLHNANRADTIFESYTVDFVNSGVQFFFSDHYLTALKMMDFMQISLSQIELKDQLYQNSRWYKDWIDSVLATLQIKSRVNIHETMRFIAWMRLYDYFHLYFRDLLRINGTMIPKDQYILRDLIDRSQASLFMKDFSGQRWQWKDAFELNLLDIDLPLYSRINFRDLIFCMNKMEMIREQCMLTDTIYADESMKLKDRKKECGMFHDSLYLKFDDE